MSKWMNRRLRPLALLALAFLITPAAHADCTNTISPTSRTHGAGVATNSVTLGASNICSWTISNTNDWIFILSETSGSGSNAVSYSVAANPNPAWRTGLVFIAGQTFTVRQNPVVCAYSLSPTTRTHGYDFTTGTVSVATSAGCAWTVNNTSSWITVLSVTNGLGNATVIYTVDDNLSTLQRTSVVMVANLPYSVVQRSSPCLFEITPTSRVHGHAGSAALISVTASGGCGWSAVTTNSWITINSGGTGTGNGSVIYTVAANPSGIGRTGLVMFAEQNFVVSQLGVACAYALSPASQAHDAGPEFSAFDVAVQSGCPWSVNNPHSWITISGGGSGTGNGTVSYGVALHPGLGTRTGVVTVASQNFMITQTGLGCTYKLSTTNRVHGYGATSNSVSITTSNTCPWDVLNTNGWITITSGPGGTGSNIVTYAIGQNPDSFQRMGRLSIGGQILTITQLPAPCSYSVAPASASHGSDSESGMVAVTAVGGCGWGVTNNNAWITITSPLNGSGSGNVSYTVAANVGASARSGTITIADSAFLVSQAATTCTYKLSPTNRTHGSGSASNAVTVTSGTGCAWSVVNTNPWITILSGNSGSGNGTVGYTVDPNPDTTDRMGIVVIDGQAFFVTQRGVGCNVMVSPGSRNHGHGSASNFVTVTTGSNCNWTATTTNTWITIVVGAVGTGNGTVGYLVAANPAALSRTGAVMVADQMLTLTQNPAPCTYSIVPTVGTHSAGATTGTVAVTTLTGCPWTVVNGQSWVAILSGSNGVGSGVVVYSVAANPATNARSATLMIGDDSFTVNQSGLPSDCSGRISPTNRMHGFGSASNSVNLTIGEGCPWVVINTNSWITIASDTMGSSSATISYFVATNSGPAERVGMVLVGDQPFTITQRVVGCSFSISPTTRSHGHGAANNTLSVFTTTNCAWSVVNTNPWISILSGGSGIGDGVVTYTVDVNYGLMPRTGVITVDGESFTLTQGGFACMFGISPANRTHGFSATTGAVSVTTTTNCPWSAITTNDWITIQSGATGMGSGGFTYAVSGNLSPTQRTGVVMVADGMITLIQRGATNGFSFEAIAVQGTGQPRLRLVGAPAGVWRLQGSSNLVNWLDVSNVTNVTGVVEYVDTAATNKPMRFYRAVQP